VFLFEELSARHMQAIRKYDSIITVMIIPIVIVLLASCASSNNSIKTHVQSIKFKSAGRIPVIDVILNGKPARFIIDTGASISILNEQEADYYGFRKIEPLADVEVAGFEGSSMMKHATKCTLEIGSLKITHIRFKSKDINALVAILYRNEQIRIAGILGADLLTQYRMQIDFMNKTISF
jgi:hypothetical protein